MAGPYYCRGIMSRDALSPWDISGPLAPIDLRAERVSVDRQALCNEAAAAAVAAGVELPTQGCILDWLQAQEQGNPTTGGEA